MYSIGNIWRGQLAWQECIFLTASTVGKMKEGMCGGFDRQVCHNYMVVSELRERCTLDLLVDH